MMYMYNEFITLQNNRRNSFHNQRAAAWHATSRGRRFARTVHDEQTMEDKVRAAPKAA